MAIYRTIFIMALLLAPGYVLASVHAQGDLTKVEIAKNSKNVDNGKFFVPKDIVVDAGTTVEWTNLDDERHTVTDGTPTAKSWGTVFDSGILKENKTFKFTFNEPGTYPYLCALHPWMLGKVTVRPVGGSLPVEVSVTTNKVAYTLGESVGVIGSISSLGDSSATVTVLNPAGAELRGESITVKEDGTFAYSFRLEGDLAIPGSYTLKVTYSGASAELTFVAEAPAPGTGLPPEVEKPAPEEESAKVQVAVKKTRDFYIVRVKNSAGSLADVYGVSFDVPDQTVEAFKGPRDWSKPATLVGEISSSTTDEPIEPGDKAIFKLKVESGGPNLKMIHWTAYGSSDNVLDSGDTKPLGR